MNDKQKAAVAWVLFGLIAISAGIQLIYNLSNQIGEATFVELMATVGWGLSPAIFGLVGVLIISRQPRNTIGLLLMLPAALFAIPFETFFAARYPTAPADPGLLIYGALWFGGWGWLLLIMPILFILVLFPTGNPFTPRWRWPIYLGLAMSFVFILLGTFSAEFAALNIGWSVPNPIGFIPQAWWDKYFELPWFTLMPLLTILCGAALFVRFRNADIIQREQIKWLFYAGSLFAVFYATSFINNSVSDLAWWNAIFAFTLWSIPIAIGIAILRYRLFDIDIIIRRTLLYGLLTITLIAVYVGTVLLTQSAFVALTGQESPIAIVISTLIIAALFNPLRKRLQEFIDRRFYRRNYDAALTLQQFAQTARDEVALDALTAELITAVQETVQPESLTLWLAPDNAVMAQADPVQGAAD